MLDLFMLALMTLCALLGPADAERFAVDLYDATSGRVRTLEVKRTLGGFELSSGRGRAVVIKALGQGKYSVQPGREEAHTFDLSAALAALAKKAPVQSLELEGEQVRVSRSPGLIFVSPTSREAGPLLVIRHRPGASPRIKIPATRPGTTKDFLGWQEYESPWELLKAQAQAGARGGHGSPAEVAIRFFASLMRGDEDYLQALSPNFKPELREKLQAEIKSHTKDLARFVSYAKIDVASALENKELGRTPQALKDTFGDYEVLMFGEGNSSRTDIYLVFERVKGKWYVKGVAASFSEFLLKSGK